MTPERWQTIERLFTAASDLTPADRPQFLDRVCAGDPELRSELESLLLDVDANVNGVIDSAIQHVAGELVAGPSTLRPGRKLGAYEILGELGRGGMGEVYLALDTRLGRRVALKLLPPHLAADRSRLERFQQEARTASGLNHPNILVVHDLAEIDDRTFIVTELVEGSTLRAELRQGPMALERVLDVAVQVAGALAAAHAAGIVHRDIKPENIMIRPDGYVKLLDFGIAKLAGDTADGVVSGTFAYMSPEQAAGRGVDARSDIFSLGVVLLEMAREKPDARLTRIAARAAANRPEDRYRQMGDLRSDLIAIQHDRETRYARRGVLQWGAAVAGAASLATGGFLLFRRKPPVNTDSLRVTKAAIPFGGGGQGAAISRDGQTIFYNRPTANGAGIWARNMETGADYEVVPPEKSQVHWALACSPDGRYLYYDSCPEPIQTGVIYRRPATGGPPQLVARGADDAASVSPNGARVLFKRYRAKGELTGLVLASADGSSERLVAVSDAVAAFYSYHWTPDGRNIQYVTGRRTPSGSEWALMEDRPEGGASRLLLPWQPFRLLSTQMTDRSGIFALSPERAGGPNQVFFISLPEGRRYQITRDTNSYYWQSVSARGDVILATSTNPVDDLWVADLSKPTPVPRRITNGQGVCRSPKWLPDGTVVYTLGLPGRKDVWATAPTGAARQLTFSGNVFDYWAGVSPDGRRLAYSAGAIGSGVLYEIDLTGGQPRPVARAEVLGSPVYSPDGKSIYYLARAISSWAVWKVPVEGGQPQRLAPCLESALQLSPDNTRLLFQVRDEKTKEIRAGLLPLDGGPVTFSAPLPKQTGDICWAGIRDFFYTIATGPDAGIWRVPLNGGVARHILKVPQRIWEFDIVPGGQQAVYAAGQIVTEFVRISGFR